MFKNKGLASLGLSLVFLILLSGCADIKIIATDYLNEEIQDAYFPLWNPKYALVSLGVSLLIHAFNASKDDPAGSFEEGRRSAANLLALVVLVGVSKTFIDLRYAWSPVLTWVVAFFAGLVLSIPVYLLGSGLGTLWKGIRELGQEQNIKNTADAVKNLSNKLREQGMSQQELNTVVNEVREEVARKIILRLSLKVNDSEAKTLVKMDQEDPSQVNKDFLDMLCRKYYNRSTSEYATELANEATKRHFQRLLARKLRSARTN